MHIVFFNPQGNFDSEDSYWTQHPDFGGQLVYVKEVAVAMAKQGHMVDIITRRIVDDKWPQFKKTMDGYKDINNLRIIRIPCGGDKFLAKEQLWEHLYEWVENIINFYIDEARMPEFVTTHYGDGGMAGVIFNRKTRIPFSFTGHSLGAQKMDKLNVNDDNAFEMEKKYRFTKRIEAERIAMTNSSVNFVSTTQERDEQYKHEIYRGAGNVNNPEKFTIAPPGANTKVFSSTEENGEDEYIRKYIKEMFERDLDSARVDLPAIVAASRLDPKKNHIALVKAYAENMELQEKANLVITVRGIKNAFEDYSHVKEEEKKILDEIMQVINSHNLKGKVSIFNINGQGQLAACYRELARRKSIFSLTAVYEPFGLAPIEAMSCGLPVAVTKYGGPSEVLYEDGVKYGILIDVFDLEDISKGILEVFCNYEFYKDKGMYRVQSKYTWDSTARKYVQAIKEAIENDNLGMVR